MTHHRPSTGLNLASGKPPTANSLESIFTKTDLATTLGQAAIAAFVHLSKFSSFRL
jgi:hypothetical protein